MIKAVVGRLNSCGHIRSQDGQSLWILQHAHIAIEAQSFVKIICSIHNVCCLEAGDDETDSGGQPRNPRRCREHPLLVCEDVEKKSMHLCFLFYFIIAKF